MPFIVVDMNASTTQQIRSPWQPHGHPSTGLADATRSEVVHLLSIPETARRIGVHPDTLYRLCRTGQFPPAIQIGRGWRVSVPRLDRYLHGDETDSYAEPDPEPIETAVGS